MIRRTMDAKAINALVNDPTIRPYVGGEGELDLTDVVHNPANYVLEAEGGAWILGLLMPGTYELHTCFRPEGRGKGYFAAAREALRYMFAETECLEIVTKCPDDNPGARMAANLMGFHERFRREDAWAPGVGISYQFFTADDWFIRDKECLSAGKRFHEILEVAKPAESELPDHPEDETHDRAAGAAYLMISGGQHQKGVSWYNRWAVFAGYPPIFQVGPSTFDIGSGVIVQARGAEMDVLRAR